MTSLKDELYFAKHKDNNKFFFGGTGKMGFKNIGSLKLSMHQKYGEKYKDIFNVYKIDVDMNIIIIDKKGK